WPPALRSACRDCVEINFSYQFCVGCGRTGHGCIVPKSGITDSFGYDNLLSAAGGGGGSESARRTRTECRRRLQGLARVLSRDGHFETNQRFGYQNRSLASGIRLEREVSGSRERRLGRRYQLP